MMEDKPFTKDILTNIEATIRNAEDVSKYVFPTEYPDGVRKIGSSLVVKKNRGNTDLYFSM